MKEFIESAVTRYAFGDRSIAATLVTGAAVSALIFWR